MERAGQKDKKNGRIVVERMGLKDRDGGGIMTETRGGGGGLKKTYIKDKGWN